MSTTKTNAINRRVFLKRASAITLVALVGGSVYRAVDNGVFSTGQGPAYEPWTNWQMDQGKSTLSLVRAAILAANPHNSQPWLFRVSESHIEVYADTTRQIGVIDPFLREMYTGVGCALENLLLAAQVEGYKAVITYMPEPTDTTYAAHIALTPTTAQPSPLYDAIPRRRTNRLPYDTTRPVEQAVLDRLAAVNDDPEVRLIWITDSTQRAALGEQIVAATEALCADEEQSIDSHAWWRADWSTLQEQRDGLTPDASLPAWLAPLAKLGPATSRTTNDAQFINTTRTTQVATAQGYGFIVVSDAMDNRLRLRGGRLWQRLHLQATIEGLAMQPLNQLPERADREAQLGLEPRFTSVLADLVNDPNFHVLMPFRFGYPTSQPTSPGPRRAVDMIVL